MTHKRMLNLGCGATFHEDWINVDFVDHGGKVLAYDLRLGIPFADESFDVVYHSHVLEHMSKSWGEFFIAECFRVLRPGGLLRVVVPDLENIARTYLNCLDAARRGEEGATQKHQWMLVELLDQLTRTQSGGEMLNYWKQKPVPQEAFVLERVGKEGELGMASVRHLLPSSPKTALPPLDTTFYLQGELHKWMYDPISLQQALTQQGFINARTCAHNESLLPQITQYGLDTTAEGHVRKPDSFFMEAEKAVATDENITEKNPRIALFSTTDNGGAAIAAWRLHEALRGIHVQSHMYVAQKQLFQQRVHVLPSQSKVHGGMQVHMLATGETASCCTRKELAPYHQRVHASLQHYPQRPQGAEYFSLPGQCVSLRDVPLLDDFDILHFHWVAGMLDPSLDMEYLKGKKIVWTLHDMNAFTGGCHYSNGCRKFEKMCGACPELGSTKERDLAFDTWRARMGTYRELDIHVVTPSAWLAKEAQKSALLGKFPIHVIANAHPLQVYKPLPREQLRAQLGLKPDSLALLFASQSLTNTRKGGMYLVNVLQILAQTSLKDRITVYMLGNNAAPEFKNTGVKVECLGHINDDAYMAALYNVSDALILPSLEDNFPNVICEALACGTPVVAFANGGISEMIRHEETGYLVPSKNVEELVQGILWADSKRQHPLTRRLCYACALEGWEASHRAAAYKKLYESLC